MGDREINLGTLPIDQLSQLKDNLEQVCARAH
jgi:hypothetical protein